MIDDDIIQEYGAFCVCLFVCLFASLQYPDVQSVLFCFSLFVFGGSDGPAVRRSEHLLPRREGQINSRLLPRPSMHT